MARGDSQRRAANLLSVEMNVPLGVAKIYAGIAATLVWASSDRVFSEKANSASKKDCEKRFETAQTMLLGIAAEVGEYLEIPIPHVERILSFALAEIQKDFIAELQKHA